MKTKVILILLLLLPVVYLLTCNRGQQNDPASFFNFPERLSSFGLFSGEPKLLIPANGVVMQELSSALFTDYAEKQRLIRLPKGIKMIIKGNGLPVYPEGTLLAKTFYYKEKIVETRLLLLKNGKWNAGTYQWNPEQTEAFYTAKASVVTLESKDRQDRIIKINYHIPSAKECVSCHQASGQIIPIGPKAMNLNRTVQRNGKNVNQLLYFQKLGLLKTEVALSSLDSIPGQQGPRSDREALARAYLDINCAHCHQPGGTAQRQSLLLNYKAPLSHTGILLNRNNILDRMVTPGPYHMPKLGTTVIDNEGVRLIKAYLETLK